MEEKKDKFKVACPVSGESGNAATEEPFPWYYRTWVIVTAILTVGPLGLLLLWFRPRTGLRLKVGVSAVVIGVTILMSMTLVDYYQELISHYEALADALGKM